MKIDLNPRLKLIAADDAKIAYAAYQEGTLYFDQAAIYTKQEDKIITHQTFTEPILNAWIKDNAVYYQTGHQTIKYEAYAQHINSYLVEEAAVTLEEQEITPLQTISTGLTLVSAGYKNAGPIMASYVPVDLVGVTLTFSKYSKAYSGTQYAYVYIDGILYNAFNYLKITEENKNKTLKFEAKAGTGTVSTDSAYVGISSVEFDDNQLVCAGITTYESSKYKFTADKDLFFSPKLTKIIVTPYSYSQDNLNYVNDVKMFIDNVDVSQEEIAFLKAGESIILTSTSGKVIPKAIALYDVEGAKLTQIKERIIDKNEWIKINEDLTTYYRPEFHTVTANGVMSVLYSNSNYIYIMLRNFDGNILKFYKESNLSRRTSANYLARGKNAFCYAIGSSLRCVDTETCNVSSFSVNYLYDSNYCAITDEINGKLYAINNSSGRRIIIDVVNKTSVNEANTFTTYGDIWIGQYGYWLYYYTTTKQLVKVNAETGEKVILEENVAAPGSVITRDEVTRDIYIFASTYSKRILMEEDKIETFTVPSEIGKVDLNYVHIANGVIYYLKYASSYSLDVQTITYDVTKQELNLLSTQTVEKRIYSPVLLNNLLMAHTETYCNSNHIYLLDIGPSETQENISFPILETVVDITEGHGQIDAKETIQAADALKFNVAERIFAPSYNDFVLGETIYAKEDQALTLKELISRTGVNTLNLKEAVQAKEDISLKALVTVYAKDKKALETKEIVQGEAKAELPMALTVYAQETNSLVLKEQTYLQEHVMLELKEVIEAAYDAAYLALELKEKVLAEEFTTLNLKELIEANLGVTINLKENVQAYVSGSKKLITKETIEPNKENGSSCVYIIEAVTTEGIMLLETVVLDASYKTRLIGFNRRVIQKRTNKE